MCNIWPAERKWDMSERMRRKNEGEEGQLTIYNNLYEEKADGAWPECWLLCVWSIRSSERKPEE